MSFVNLRELEQMAKLKVDNMIFEYYRSGGNEEITKDDNINAFKRIHLDPRVLVDVSKVNTETTILGHKIAFPIGIAPTAMQKMAHPKGENISALVAKQHNIPFVLSTLSTSTFEEVASQGGLQFFQLYIQKDRSLTEQVVKQAESNNFKAIIVTVDAPVLGKREADERQKFSLPSHLKLQILDQVAQKNNKNLQNVTNQEGSGLMKFFADQLDQSLTWKDISWLRGITKLPIVLKGIQSAEDAVLAKQHGVDAIWVSNHGGRQLDTVRATIDILPEVVKAIGDSIEIYVDGGVRGGTDVFKCLQLGAKCVFIGRPVLYSMIIDGEQGVNRMLNILEKEFIQTLQLMGRPKL